jgi:hypothetical protein
MSSPGNGAPGAPGTGPALGYSLNLLWFIFLFVLVSGINMNTSTYHVITRSLLFVMIKILILGIKIYRKLPSFLTIQKPYDVNRLTVASFAQILKPSVFNGTNFKRWHDRMILWLMAMNVYHIAQEKPGTFVTPERSKLSWRLITCFKVT